MAEMKILTVNGIEYEVTDGKAARIDDSQVGPAAWSSKNIVDKLAPAFEESGSIVTCQPVEGYPLTVTAEEGATEIVRCGKNLLSSDVYDLSNWDGVRYMLALKPGIYTISGELDFSTGGAYVYVEKSTDNGASWTPDHIAISGYYDHGYIAMSTKQYDVTFEVTGADGELWSIWAGSNHHYFPKIKALQIERGNTASAIELYKGETFTAGEAIPALPGVNTLWADADNITVTGRADPNAVIADIYEKLNAVLATTAALTGV